MKYTQAFWYWSDGNKPLRRLNISADFCMFSSRAQPFIQGFHFALFVYLLSCYLDLDVYEIVLVKSIFDHLFVLSQQMEHRRILKFIYVRVV